MTENEATREMTFEEEYEILQKEKEELFAMEICDSEPPFANCVVRRASRCIRKLLEEIQQYRAIQKMIGIPLEVFAKLCVEKVPEECKNPQKAIILTDEDVDKWQAYKSIGTVEEFKALKEKSVAKKVIRQKSGFMCPTCGYDGLVCFASDGNDKNCSECGQKLDWQ